MGLKQHGMDKQDRLSSGGEHIKTNKLKVSKQHCNVHNKIVHKLVYAKVMTFSLYILIQIYKEKCAHIFTILFVSNLC